MPQPVEFFDKGPPRATACSTALAHTSNTRRVRERRRLQPLQDRPLLIRAGVPFFDPPVQSIAADPENPADRPLRPSLPVGPKDLFLLGLGVAPGLRIKDLTRPAVLAVILLGAAGAVAVFDNIGATTLAALVSCLNHRSSRPMQTGRDSIQMETVTTC